MIKVNEIECLVRLLIFCLISKKQFFERLRHMIVAHIDITKVTLLVK